MMHPRQQHGDAEGQPGHRRQNPADHIRLDDVDDQVLHLHAQAREPLAATAAEAVHEDFADRLNAKPPIRNGVEDADQRQREERVDRVPHAPDAAGDDVAGDAVGRRAADARAGDADSDHQHAHPPTGDGPVIAAPTASEHQNADECRTGQIGGYHRKSNRVLHR